MRAAAAQHLAEAAARLAKSLIGSSIYNETKICTSCHMGAIADQELHHVPSCVVGQVLEAVRVFEAPANKAEEEFFDNEDRPELAPPARGIW